MASFKLFFYSEVMHSQKRPHLHIHLEACVFIKVGKFLCQRPATFFKKETLTKVFSCEFCEIFQNNFFSQNISGGCFYLFQVFIPTVSYDFWLSKYFFYFELSCNTCQCFLTLCNIYTETHISIYRIHIFIYRTHISIYIISCCNFVTYCNFVTRKNL